MYEKVREGLVEMEIEYSRLDNIVDLSIQLER